MVAARHALTDESVALITLALSALVDAADVFPSIIRTDLHACLLQIMIKILGTPATQALVVPQVLPIFRRFVSSLASTSLPETQSQLRSTLERFILIITNAQKREFEAAAQCEKNTLLASTILLTSAAGVFEPSDPLLKRIADLLTECLHNRVTSKVASNCCRSLLILPKTRGGDGTATATSLAQTLLPPLIAFLASPPPADLEGLDESRSIVSLALTNFVATLAPADDPKQVQLAMALVLPTLLARASREEGEASYRETAARLIELAGAGQEAFRAVVGGLGSEQRGFMEGVVRRGGEMARGGRREPVRQDSGSEGVPRIALRMDFGV